MKRKFGRLHKSQEDENEMKKTEEVSHEEENAEKTQLSVYELEHQNRKEA